MDSEAQKPNGGTNKPDEGTDRFDGSALRNRIKKCCKKFKGSPFTKTIALAVFLGVMALVLFLLLGPISNASDDSSKKVLKVLEGIPRNLGFYVFIAGFVIFWLSWRFYLHTKLKEKLDKEYENALEKDLNDRDWWTYHGFRIRAFALRTKADIMLGCVFALLLAGIYFVVFIVPELEEIKEKTVTKAIREAQLNVKFDAEFQAVDEGRYWFITHPGDSSRLQSRTSVVTFNGVKEFQELRNPPRAIRTAETSGNIGLVARRNGSAIVTIDGGQTWKPMKLALKRGDWITDAKLNDEGKRGLLVSNEGKVVLVLLKQNGEFSPLSSDSKLDDKEQFRHAAFSGDAKRGLLVGDKGTVVSVSVKQKDGISQKFVKLLLKDKERIHTTAFSEGGNHAFVVGNRGSALFASVQNDGALLPATIDLALQNEEWITNVKISRDGKFGLIIGSKGSALVATDRGKTRNKMYLQLLPEKIQIRVDEHSTLGMPRERIIASLPSTNGEFILMVGIKGSVFRVPVKPDDGTDPDVLIPKLQPMSNLTLEDKEGIISVYYSNDGKFALLVSNKGSIFRVSLEPSDKSSQSAQKPDLKLDLRPGDIISRRNVRKDNKLAPIVSNKGAVFLVSLSSSGKLSQDSRVLRLQERERIRTFTFSKDGKRGLVVGSKGSVFVTADSGRNWSKGNVRLRRENWITAAILSTDGRYGMVADNQGFLFVTKNGGRKWKPTLWDAEETPQLQYLFILTLNNIDSVAMDKFGNAYFLKKHPKMKEPITRSSYAAKNKFIKDSNIFKKIIAFLGPVGYIEDNESIDGPDDNETQKSKPSTNIFGMTLQRITLVQIATMTILFFLVQLLVRLYQYSTRLAYFWDSRADAILLHQNFAEKVSERFDDLVQALAPDTYDFKPMPRSAFDWMSTSKRNP